MIRAKCEALGLDETPFSVPFPSIIESHRLIRSRSGSLAPSSLMGDNSRRESMASTSSHHRFPENLMNPIQQDQNLTLHQLLSIEQHPPFHYMDVDNESEGDAEEEEALELDDRKGKRRFIK